MRLIGVCLVFAAAPFLFRPPAAADGYLLSAQLDVVTDVLRAVSAGDADWYHVLKQPVKVNRAELNAHVADMLDELNVSGEHVKVHEVVSYVVGRAGATGSQKRFVARVLGTGVWCQLMGTLLVHTTIAWRYSQRPVRADDVRLRMSRIQMSLPGYADKLAFFGRSVEHVTRFADIMNKAFAENDKKSYTKCLARLSKQLKTWMGKWCGVTDEPEIGDRLKINNYDRRVFDDAGRKGVDDHQMLTMIDDLDGYGFIDVKMMDAKRWMEHLKIEEFRLGGSELVNASGDDEDD